MRVNVSVIVVHDSKVLLMQRSLTDDYFPGAWGIPGGNMELEDMTLEETAIRETKEELGIEIMPTGVLSNNKNIDTDTFYLVVSAKLKNTQDYPNKITLSEEANAYKWASKVDLSELEFTPFTLERIQTALEKSE
jgi:8-oxo-dGTP diphosphatase